MLDVIRGILGKNIFIPVPRLSIYALIYSKHSQAEQSSNTEKHSWIQVPSNQQ